MGSVVWQARLAMSVLSGVKISVSRERKGGEKHVISGGTRPGAPEPLLSGCRAVEIQSHDINTAIGNSPLLTVTVYDSNCC